MATARNTFEYTATGILGNKRPSMLENELHLRVKVFCIIYVGFLRSRKGRDMTEGSV